MKKKIILALAIALLLSSCGNTGSSSAEKDTTKNQKEIIVDEPYYSSLEDLTADSIAIFEGKVNGKHTEYINDTTGEIVSEDKAEDSTVFVYTVCDVSVTEVFKGSAEKNMTVQVKLFGDSDKAVALTEGEDYLFFTDCFETDLQKPMWLLNQIQSIYVKNGSSYAPVDEKLNELKFDQSELENAVKSASEGNTGFDDINWAEVNPELDAFAKDNMAALSAEYRRSLELALEDAANIKSEDAVALWAAKDDPEELCRIADGLFHGEAVRDTTTGAPFCYCYGGDQGYAIRFQFSRNLRLTNDDPDDKYKTASDDGLEINITTVQNAKTGTGTAGTVLLRRFDTDGTELPVPERTGEFDHSDYSVSEEYVLYWIMRGIAFDDPGDPFYR